VSPDNMHRKHITLQSVVFLYQDSENIVCHLPIL